MSEEINENEETEGEPKSPGNEPGRETVPCPECRGSGVIALLVTSRPCTRCDGRGWIEPAAKAQEPEAPAPEPEGACESYPCDAGAGECTEVICRTYDAQGRLTSETLTPGQGRKSDKKRKT